MVLGTAVDLVFHLMDGETPTVVLSFFTSLVPGAAAVDYGWRWAPAIPHNV
ncbi:MAG: hypothetical protein GF403_10100 [Candidatus Coatesbacteria bacterium]|nr:hypothetical protein [Candidatus Coatesbacteria bacterium]